MLYGYNGKILHVNLSDYTTRVEEPDEVFYRLYAGCGLLSTYYLLKETPAGIDAYDPANLLIFASSVMAGYPAAGLPRYTVCAKSPLTQGIGEARGEGPFGIALKRSGYDAIIFSGASKTPVSLLIDNGEIQFVDSEAIWGKTVGEATDQLEKQFGAEISAAAIGPAGENRVRFASVVNDRGHQAHRMGMGGVMGSKRLKAVVLRGGELPPLAHPDIVDAMTADFGRRIESNSLSTWQKVPPGFAIWIHTHGLDAALDVENFRTPEFAALDNYEAHKFLKFDAGVAPCPGCPNDCIKILHAGDDDLDPRASGIHQEITGAMGPNIGLENIKTLLRINNLLNQWGMDATSLGFTLSLVMELADRGIVTQDMTDGIDLRFGNEQAILEMVRRTAYREGFGDTLAEGAKRVAQKIGDGAERYALHVKGLEMVPFEPRSQTNLALGFAVAPVGPRYDICEHDWDYDTVVGWDHTMNFSRTLGILERIPMQYLGPEKVKNFKVLSNLWSGADALGLCIFASAPTRLLSLEQMAQMLHAVTGWETSSFEILRWGERRNHLMRVYNNREGLSTQDDGLPDRFYDEPIASGRKQGDVLDREKFRQMLDLYYQMMGWDENGVPRPATLYEYQLEWTLHNVSL